MTTLANFLEDFAAAPATQATVETGLSEAEVEGQRLEAFENGYKAGWDDAIKAQSDDTTRISSAFGQHLQDLSFTYQEAYAQVLKAMTPLLEEMANVVLPSLARDSLGQHIAEELRGMAQRIGHLDVVIAVAPANRQAVAALLDGDFAFPVKLVEDDTLAEEQADIRFGETEAQIDLTDLVQDARDAIAGFAHDARRKAANG